MGNESNKPAISAYVLVTCLSIGIFVPHRKCCNYFEIFMQSADTQARRALGNRVTENCAHTVFPTVVKKVLDHL